MALITHLPQFMQAVYEFNVLFDILDDEYLSIKNGVNLIYKNIYINEETANEILQKWEKLFNISSSGTSKQRADRIILKLKGYLKLNENEIRTICKFYNNNENLDVYFKDLTLFIEMNNLKNQDIIYEEISKRLPAHIDLVIKNFVAKWQNVYINKNVKQAWDFYNEKTWQNLKDIKL